MEEIVVAVMAGLAGAGFFLLGMLGAWVGTGDLDGTMICREAPAGWECERWGD